MGGIKYLYKNGVWQIHWNTSSRYQGIIDEYNERKTIKFLVTSGPTGEQGQKLWEEHGIVFFSYAYPSSSEWQYPFPEGADLSCNTEYLLSLKLPACLVKLP